MLENYEIKVLEHDLLDYNAWATHVVSEGIFKDIETALHYKAKRCADRMIMVYESRYGDLAGTIEDKVNICSSHKDYKNRAEREAELL